jgi:hypothetical protein
VIFTNLMMMELIKAGPTIALVNSGQKQCYSFYKTGKFGINIPTVYTCVNGYFDAYISGSTLYLYQNYADIINY